MRHFLVLACLFFVVSGLFAQDTITVMQYNLLEYGNYNSAWASCDESTNNTQEKDECIRTILNHVRPDILTVNEFGASQAILDNFLRHNLNINGVDYWKSDNIVNYANSNIINHIFYNSSKMELKRHAVIRTSLRDIDAYELYFKTTSLAAHDTVKLVCIVAHLKAGNGSTEEATRRAMLNNAMYWVEENCPHDNVLIMGDFNMYKSSESGYRLLTETYENPDARFVDPLSLVNGVGYWDNNHQFAQFHTQSTKSWVDYPDCPSGGGLDSRFDIMMMSDEIYMGFNNLKYVNGSYKAVGNDGLHFNQSINDGYNNAVPEAVANALYKSSDHLPITMKMRLFAQLDVDETAVVDFSVYPNPTTGTIHVTTPNSSSSRRDYRITNVLGQAVMTGKVNNDGINVSGLMDGLYFISVDGVTRKFVKN